MIDQHPITPPLELVHQWADMVSAARWGADQELEACLKWMESFCPTWTCGRRPEDVLRSNRRPKPPSLKEQALEALHTSVDLDDFPKQYDTIRRALEALPND